MKRRVPRYIPLERIKDVKLRRGDYIVTAGVAVPYAGGGKPTRITIGLWPCDVGWLEGFMVTKGPKAQRRTRRQVLERAIKLGLEAMERERKRARKAAEKGGAHA